MNTIQADPFSPNEFLKKAAERLVKENALYDDAILSRIYLLPNNPNHFKLEKATSDEILKCLKSLWNDQSTRYGNITILFVKSGAEYIFSLLVFCMKNLIEEFKFPEQWKITCMSPIPKVTNPTQLENYRPILILPVLWNKYEKLIY